MDASPKSQASASQDRPDLRIGEVLCNKWRIESVLGVGAMGTVYAARHHNGNRVAIKILHASLAEFTQIKERFLNEAKAANRVKHRAVTAVHDEGVAADGSIFLVMELLQGQTLDAYQEKRGNLGAVQGLRVIHEVLDALIVAHSVGVLHRDIKPANIFLTIDGRVVLLDFGVAQLTESRSATQLGIPIGTPSYMPPEQASGRWQEVDGRSDLWAVGATLFRLLSGRTVRQESTAEEELRAAVSGVAPSLATACSAPAEVVALVDKALSFDREQRFADAASMQEAVREAIVSLGATLPRDSNPSVFAGDAPWLDPDELLAPGIFQDVRASSIRLKPTATVPSFYARRRVWTVRMAVTGMVVSLVVLLAVLLSAPPAVVAARPAFAGVSHLSSSTLYERDAMLRSIDLGIDLPQPVEKEIVVRRIYQRVPVPAPRRPVKNKDESFDPFKHRE